MKYDKLFEPIKIGPVEIPNRIAVSPMGGGYENGELEYIAWYTARAVGGFGLIITGAIHTNKRSHDEVPPFFPGLYKDCRKPIMQWFSLFTHSIHSQGTGTKVFAQLTPGFGRQAPKPGAASPSAIPMDADLARKNVTKMQGNWAKYCVEDWQEEHKPPREMSIDEIHADEISFIQGADLAIQFGFDGIEIHAPHGYLLHQFLSARSNQRKDEYGGSLRNRARYLLELLAMCKNRFSNKVPIVVRISGEEGLPGGLTADDMRQVAKWCEELGADAIDLSNGAGYEDFERFVGFYGQTDNYPLLEVQGKKMREAVNIPVITPGLMTPAVALKAVTDGQTDMISLGRQSVADPDWPNKLKEGRENEIIKCIKCGMCTGYGIMAGTGTSRMCSQNPRSGLEQFFPEYLPKPMKCTVPETLKRLEPGLRKDPEIKRISVDRGT